MTLLNDTLTCAYCAAEIPVTKGRGRFAKRPICGAHACKAARLRDLQREHAARERRRQAESARLIRWLAGQDCIDPCAHYATARRQAIAILRMGED